MPEDLPEGYYLENFSFLVRFVADAYPHLLTEAELGFASEFFDLDEPTQKLFVRLSNRKGALFRTDRLSYSEIPELSDALECLVTSGFAARVIPVLADAVTLCTKDELISLPEFEGLPRQTKKSELIERLESLDQLEQRSVNPIEYHNTEVVEIQSQETLAIYRLLFFGNFHQDMTEFVMHELVAPFERYAFNQEAAPFDSRESVDRLIELKLLSDLSYEVLEADATGDALLALLEHFPARPSERLHARRFDKTMNAMARQLERLERHADALRVYSRTQSAPSRERRARINAALGDHGAALLLCESIDKDPVNEAERVFARTFGNRLAKQKKLKPNFPVVRRPSDIPQTTLVIGNVKTRVELSAQHYYNTQPNETVAFYVENTLFRSLFGLCFWDVIFAPVAGAFFNPFQRGPVDLFTQDFVPNRKSLIDERLAALASGGMDGIARTTFTEKSGIANQFVSWGYFTEELLELTLARIPISHTLLIFRRMLTDLKNNSTGFPDLILFHPDGYELVEIKGPGDKLQENQTRWFSYFIDHGISASVVNIEYEEVTEGSLPAEGSPQAEGSNDP